MLVKRRFWRSFAEEAHQKLLEAARELEPLISHPPKED